MKFYVLADKYLQEDLCEKCLNFLTSRINMDTVYKILDFFAHEENVPQIRLWCTKLLKDKLNLQNVKRFIKYLADRQEDPEFKENNKEVRNQAINFVLENFFEINENENMEIYEDFIMKNIDMETVSALAGFLGSSHELPENAKEYPLKRRKAVRVRAEVLEERITRIKEAAFSFVYENVKTVMTSKAAKDFKNAFFIDFTLYSAERAAKEIQALKKVSDGEMRIESQENNKEVRKGNEKKRMEPVKDDEDEEMFELKKTKKSDSTWRII